jgi:glycosyltransferase involved in cell wall biosynthesis
MRFSVDAHAIGQHLTGNETYIRNLLSCFASLDDQSEFVTYLSRENAFSSVPERFIKRRVAVDPFVRLGFDLPRMLRQDRPDLLHVQYTAPLFCNVPTVVSVHDVSFLEHPEYFTFFRTSQLRTTVRQTVKRAARILTPSEFSKRSILRAYPLRDDKVVVLPNAVSNAFRPIARELAQRRVFSMLGVPKPIVLTVGDVQPR